MSKPSCGRDRQGHRRGLAVAPALAWLDDGNNHIVTLADGDYPQSLLNIPDPPLLLYVKGRLDLLNHSALAVVGSRNATPQGAGNAEAFASSSAMQGCASSAAWLTALMPRPIVARCDGRGSSIAVVGTGLDKVYPAANRELAHALAEQGALISEFPLGTPPLPANFPRRNRIISGMSLGCLVVEASLQSGSLITARLALSKAGRSLPFPVRFTRRKAKAVMRCSNRVRNWSKPLRMFLRNCGARFSDRPD